ncbi:MAG: hypothetical protein NWT08_14450 [Akkermansiaceae bacterium]|jgi:hypothetical protein|nr:hypothetical protein [Akkermansiaceae bacterium]MDP4646694.1 hypothetical protein [Akkermansiaceae bacterium]MDP4721096.1 hypothetical protein [Akkermansiaceae bacterium]MDP4779610.1 hypothetical protein [Akkermansiaceae bacterium]MDP4846310.1 hypothetical protein [Akkermansiaceae bacterium]
MRISPLIVLPLCLLTIAFIWWTSTREMDFITPPSEARLEEIREEAIASIPVTQNQDDAIAIKVPIPNDDITIIDPIESTEPVDLGDLTTPPVLDTYSDRAPEGAGKLLALATALEKNGTFQRALLANERVLDLAQSNPNQIQAAVSNIQRIRPTLTRWNRDSETGLPVTIHIGTGEKFADVLPEILGQITADLENASSGLLTFDNKLNIGRSIQDTDAPTPVAVWITGGGEGEISTDVLSFTSDDPQSLNNDLLKTVFNLIRGHLQKSASYNPAPEAIDDPLSALNSHITRLLWQEFGTVMNPEQP